MDWQHNEIKGGPDFVARSFAAYCSLPQDDTKFLLFGGMQKDDKNIVDDLAVVKFDTESNTFVGKKLHTESVAPSARLEATLTLVKPKHAKQVLEIDKAKLEHEHHHDDEVEDDPHKMHAFLFGGRNGKTYFNDTFLLHIEHVPETKKNTYRWEKIVMKATDKVPSARSNHTCVFYRHGTQKKMYVFGGYDGKHALQDLWCFDLESHTWEQINDGKDKPLPRFGHSAVVVDFSPFIANSKVKFMIVACGQKSVKKSFFLKIDLSGADNYFNDFWRYDFEAKNWAEIKIPNNPVTYGRAFHSCCYIHRACLALYGGEFTGKGPRGLYLIDVYAQKAALIPYLKTTKASWPSHRKGHYSVYDTVNKRILISNGLRASEKGYKEMPNGLKDVYFTSVDLVFRIGAIGTMPVSKKEVNTGSSHTNVKPGVYRDRSAQIAKVDKYTLELAKDPKNLTLLKKRYDVFFSLGVYDKAMLDLKQLKLLEPGKTDEHLFNEAFMLYKQAANEEAIEMFGATEKKTKDANQLQRITSYKTKAYLRMDLLKECVDEANKLVSQIPSGDRKKATPESTLMTTVTAFKAYVKALSLMRNFAESKKQAAMLKKYLELENSLTTKKNEDLITFISLKATNKTMVTIKDYISHQLTKLSTVLYEVEKFERQCSQAAMLYEKAVKLIEQNSLEEATKMMNRAHEQDPRNVKYVAELVKLHQDARSFKSIIQLLQDFLDSQPYYYDGYFSLCKAYVSARTMKEAIDTLTKGKKLAEKRKDFPSVAKFATEMETVSAKSQNIQSALKLSEHAKGQIREKQYGEAIESLTKAAALDGENAYLYIDRANVHTSMKNYGDAIIDAYKAINVAPENGDGHLTLVNILVTANHWTKALDAVELGLQRDMQHSGLLQQHAYVKELLRNKSRSEVTLAIARELVNKKVELIPSVEKFDIVIYTQTEVPKADKEYIQDIIEKLSKAIEFYPYSLEALMLRARCYYAVRYYGKSSRDAKSVLDIYEAEQSIKKTEATPPMNENKLKRFAKKMNILSEAAQLAAKGFSSLSDFAIALQIIDDFPVSDIVDAQQKGQITAALKQVRANVDKYHQTSKTYMNEVERARELYRNAKYEESAKEYEKVIKQFDHTSSGNQTLLNLYFEAAECHFQMHSYQKCKELVDFALSQDNSMPQMYTLKAATQVAQKELDAALANIEFALDNMSPHNLPLNAFFIRLKMFATRANSISAFEAAKKAYEKKEYFVAIDLLRKSGDKWPLTVSAYTLLARAYVATNCPQRALDCIFHITKIVGTTEFVGTPQTATKDKLLYEITKIKAIAYLQQRKMNESTTAFSTCGVWKEKLKLKDDAELKAAEEKKNIAATRLSNNMDYLEKADAAIKMGKKDRAVRLYHKIIEVEPDYSAYYSTRGKLLYELGEIPRAITDCDKAIGLNLLEVEAYVTKFYCMLDRLMYKEAEALIDEVKKIFKYTKYLKIMQQKLEERREETKEAQDSYEKGQKLIAENKFEDAEELLAKAKHLTPYDPQYLIAYIEFLFSQNEYKDARDELDLLIKLHPRHNKTWELRTRLYTEFIKDPYEALISVISGLERDKYNEVFWKQLKDLLSNDIVGLQTLFQQNMKTAHLGTELDQVFSDKYLMTVMPPPPNQEQAADLSALLSEDDLKELDNLDLDGGDEENAEETEKKAVTPTPAAAPKGEFKNDVKNLFANAFGFLKGIGTVAQDSSKKKKTEAFLHAVRAYEILGTPMSDALIQQLTTILQPEGELLKQQNSNWWKETGYKTFQAKIFSERLAALENDDHVFYTKKSFQNINSYSLWKKKELEKLKALIASLKVTTEKLVKKETQFHEEMMLILIDGLMEVGTSVSDEMIQVVYTMSLAYGYSKVYTCLIMLHNYAKTIKSPHAPFNVFKTLGLLVIAVMERSVEIDASNKMDSLFITSKEMDMFEKGMKMIYDKLDSALYKHYRCIGSEDTKPVVRIYVKIAGLMQLIQTFADRINLTSFKDAILTYIEENQKNALQIFKKKICEVLQSQNAGYTTFLAGVITNYMDAYDSFFDKVFPNSYDYMIIVCKKFHELYSDDLMRNANNAMILMQKTAKLNQEVPIPTSLFDLRTAIDKFESSISTYLDDFEPLVQDADKLIIAYLNMMLSNQAVKLKTMATNAIKIDTWTTKVKTNRFTSSVSDVFQFLQEGWSIVTKYTDFLLQDAVTYFNRVEETVTSEIKKTADDDDDDEEKSEEELREEGEKLDMQKMRQEASQKLANVLMLYLTYADAIVREVVLHWGKLLQETFAEKVKIFCKFQNTEEEEEEELRAFDVLTLALGNCSMANQYITDMMDELKSTQIDNSQAADIQKLTVKSVEDTKRLFYLNITVPMINLVVRDIFMRQVLETVDLIMKAATEETSNDDLEVLFGYFDQYLVKIYQAVPKDIFLPLLRTLFDEIFDAMKGRIVPDLKAPLPSAAKIAILKNDILPRLKEYFTNSGQGIDETYVENETSVLKKVMDLAIADSNSLIDEYKELKKAAQEDGPQKELSGVLVNYALHFLRYHAAKKDAPCQALYDAEIALYNAAKSTLAAQIEADTKAADTAAKLYTAESAESNALRIACDEMKQQYYATKTLSRDYHKRMTVRAQSKALREKTFTTQDEMKADEGLFNFLRQFVRMELTSLEKHAGLKNQDLKDLAQQCRDDLQGAESGAVKAIASKAQQDTFVVSEALRAKFKLGKSERLYARVFCSDLKTRVPGTLYVFTSCVQFEAKTKSQTGNVTVLIKDLLKVSKGTKESIESNVKLVTKTNKSFIAAGVRDKHALFTDICQVIQESGIPCEFRKEGFVCDIVEQKAMETEKSEKHKFGLHMPALPQVKPLEMIKERIQNDKNLEQVKNKFNKLEAKVENKISKLEAKIENKLQKLHFAPPKLLAKK